MTCNCKGMCGLSKLAWVLVIVGALNWGIVGVSTLVGSPFNLVTVLVGAWPMVEAIVYVLVGLSALLKVFGCPCKKCKESCAECHVSAPMESPKM